MASERKPGDKYDNPAGAGYVVTKKASGNRRPKPTDEPPTDTSSESAR